MRPIKPDLKTSLRQWAELTAASDATKAARLAEAEAEAAAELNAEIKAMVKLMRESNRARLRIAAKQARKAMAKPVVATIGADGSKAVISQPRRPRRQFFKPNQPRASLLKHRGHRPR